MVKRVKVGVAGGIEIINTNNFCLDMQKPWMTQTKEHHAFLYILFFTFLNNMIFYLYICIKFKLK